MIIFKGGLFMKIYRVVPNGFLTGRRLETTDKVATEAVYYEMGYTPFSGNPGNHDFNSLDCDNLQGKYFYLFAEDAILEGNKLMINYHRLRSDICSMLEYDVPIDIIMKHIGYGDYTTDIFPLHLIESFIEKDDLGNNVTHSHEMDKNEKLKYLFAFFKQSLNTINEYGINSWDDLEYYEDLFGTTDFLSITDEEIKQALLNSEFYSTFLNQQRELVSSPYITGRVLPVNPEFLSYELKGNYDKIKEYYQNLGVRYEFSEEHREFKKELLNTINQGNQDQGKIKSLLESKKYI